MLEDSLINHVRKACNQENSFARAHDVCTIIEHRSNGDSTKCIVDIKEYAGYRSIQSITEEEKRAYSSDYGIGCIPARVLVREIYPELFLRMGVWTDFLRDYSTNVDKQVRSTIKWCERFYETPKSSSAAVMSKFLHETNSTIVDPNYRFTSAHPLADELARKAYGYRAQIKALLAGEVVRRGIENEDRGGRENADVAGLS